MSEPKGRLKEFEALRGLSIVLLLTLHSEIIGPSVYGISLDPFAQFIATFLLGSFFFLAGYFMDASLQKYRENIFGYIQSRLIRIFPPYWVSLIFFIQLYTLKKLDLFVYILNLQAIFSPEFVKPLLTLWYISMLVVYYIIYSVLLWRGNSNRNLLIFSIVIFAVSFIVHNATGLLDQRFFRYFLIFLVGIYFYRFEKIREFLFNLPVIYKIVGIILSSIGFLIVLVQNLSLTNGFQILAADFFILTWILVWLSVFRTKIGDQRIWFFLSTASYFAYLFHRPLWYLLQSIVGPNISISKQMLDFIPGSILTLIIGYFLQRGYDRLLALFRLK